MLVADRIIRLKTVLARAGLSRSTIYRKIAEGTFPAQVRISVNGAGWRESDIDRWIADPTGWRATNETTNGRKGEYPIGEGRLAARSGGDGSCRTSQPGEVESVYNFDHGHKFEGQAAAPVLAGGAEARDRGGIADAGRLGVGGGAAIRREQQPGVRVAQALWRGKCGGAGPATCAGRRDAGSTR